MKLPPVCPPCASAAPGGGAPGRTRSDPACRGRRRSRSPRPSPRVCPERAGRVGPARDRACARPASKAIRRRYEPVGAARNGGGGAAAELDRKSTRLNQSLMRISYAVFCLKKKKRKYKYIL